MPDVFTLRDGSIAQPALISGAVAIAAWAAMESGSTVFGGIIGRVLTDSFSRTILTIAVWACMFGLIQIWGCRSDSATQLGRVSRWILGRDREIAVHAVQVNDTWETMVRRRSAPLSYAVWVLPTLGFLGTVLGISGAIGEMSGVFSQDADRSAALAAVLVNLEFAFDTTFAGLVGAVPAMALLVGMRTAADTALRAVQESIDLEAEVDL